MTTVRTQLKEADVVNNYTNHRAAPAASPPAAAAEARGVARVDRRRARDALARVFQEALAHGGLGLADAAAGH